VNQATLVRRLSELAEPSYAAFSKKLQVSHRTILGVRTPHLNKLASLLAKTEGVKAFSDFYTYENPSYEEIIVIYKLLGLLLLPSGEGLSHLVRLLPYNESWATNDSLASSLKPLCRYPDTLYPFLLSLLKSNHPYEQRLGIVALMLHFLKEPTFDEVLAAWSKVKNDHYYVVMALGWAYATAYCKEKEKTLAYLQKGVLQEEVRRKAIQKCIESRIPSEAEKHVLKELRQAP
jgi:3-methyladenine DNA glycosylase AlkD